MSNGDERERKARAERLRRQIDELSSGSDSPAAAESESVADDASRPISGPDDTVSADYRSLIHKRMAELEREKKKDEQ